MPDSSPPETTSPSLPAAVQRYKDLYQRYLAMQNAYIAEARAIQEAEFGRRIREDDQTYRLLFKFDQYDINNQMHKMAGELVSKLCEIAEEHFAVTGTRFDIDSKEVAAEFMADDDHGNRRARFKKTFSVEGIWAFLEAKYGGDAALKVAYEQSASQIKNALDLERRGGQKRLKRSGPFVDIEFWSRFESKYSGGYRISYSDCEKLSRLAGDLDTFLTWHGDLMGYSPNQMRQLVSANSENAISRMKLSARPFEITLFKDKGIFRMPGDLADRLNEFISTYSPIKTFD